MKRLYWTEKKTSSILGVWVEIEKKVYGDVYTILAFYRTKDEHVKHLSELTDDEIIEGLEVATEIGDFLETQGYKVKR